MYVKYIVIKNQDFLKAQVRFRKMQKISFVYALLKILILRLSSAQLAVLRMPINGTEFISLKTNNDIAEAAI